MCVLFFKQVLTILSVDVQSLMKVGDMEAFHGWEGEVSFLNDVNHTIYVCSMLKLCVLTPVESVYIESMMRPVEGFNERLISIISANDTDASLRSTERVCVKHRKLESFLTSFL